MEKYDINDEAYIVSNDKIIKCKVIEITKNINCTKYTLLDDNKIEYLRLEREVFKNMQEAEEYIKQIQYNRKINAMEIGIIEYQGWVSDLDYAIQNYENCETNIQIHLLSNQTNGKDKQIFNVTNTGSIKILEYIKKYFKEEYDKRELELQKLKKEFENVQDNGK